MAVDGGMTGLLNKFVDHFDDSLTPPGAEFKPLVKEIPKSVLTAELPDFFEQLVQRISGRLWYNDSESAKVLNEAFNLSNESVKTALTAYLKQKNRDVKFLNVYPHRLVHMQYTDTELRNLWKARMVGNDAINVFNLYAELLRNSHIPTEEISSVNSAIFNHFNQWGGYRELPASDADIITLVQNGFFETVFEIAIKEKKLKMMKWVNQKTDLIALMIKHSPLKDETVACICKMATSEWPSQWLIRELKTLFAETPVIKQSFDAAAARLGISVPDDFGD